MGRFLDIGPGSYPVPGFETLDVVRGPHVTHVGRAESPPFEDNTFDIVHASHVLEHVNWYDVEATVKQWVRILKPGGQLEVWVPDAYKLMKTLIVMEETGEWTGPGIGTWKSDLTKYDPYKWAVGRMLNYPKKAGIGEVWLHRALITPKYLQKVFSEAGLIDIKMMTEDQIRGMKNHGWIQMGVVGTKK